MHITPFHAERERLKLKLSFLIQQHFNPAPEYSEKNRCRVCHNFNECRLFFSDYSGTGLKYYWIRNNNFNFNLSLSKFPKVFFVGTLKLCVEMPASLKKLSAHSEKAKKTLEHCYFKFDKKITISNITPTTILDYPQITILNYVRQVSQTSIKDHIKQSRGTELSVIH